jgi:uncharacterized protein YbjT (DUF2867 family)
MQVTIAPASNKTSTAAIRSLLSQNNQVQVKGLYRDPKKVPDEFRSANNFSAVQGDVGDVNTLDFSGSDAVLMVLPPAYDGRDIVEHAQRISNNVKTAIEKAGGVKRLVLLSSVGAEFSEGVVSLPFAVIESHWLTDKGRAQDKSHFRTSLKVNGYP